jgi:hypothetical protein
LAALKYLSLGLSLVPLMMSGVRASSMRIESTSSITQYEKGVAVRSTSSTGPCVAWHGVGCVACGVCVAEPRELCCSVLWRVVACVACGV